MSTQLLRTWLVKLRTCHCNDEATSFHKLTRKGKNNVQSSINQAPATCTQRLEEWIQGSQAQPKCVVLTHLEQVGAEN
jgi:hypothetical protein